MASTMSSTPPAQGDPAVVGGWLSSISSHYRVESLLGKGSYGTVAKCTRMLDGKTVAIKMMKNRGSLVASACAEVAALLKLQSLDSDKCNLVQWHQVFTYKEYNCLEFEHLEKSLYDFMMERYYQPLLPQEIRPIVQQLATALHHLKGIGMIHGDLKMENVMLVNHVREPYRVKLIDFGLACKTSDAHLGSYIQTRPFRSPEIILGLPFTEAIDMWSLGCLAATLNLGTLLYPGQSEYDMMRYIVDTQGQPPDELLSLGLKTGWFFQKDKSSTTSLWKLKTPEQFKAEMGIQPMENRSRKLSSLYDLLHKPEKCTDESAELNDGLTFVDLLNWMLELDAAKRVTPRQALEHPFISMCNMKRNSSYVRSCFEIMDLCQKKTPASDCGKAVCGSVQQPSSGTAQQNLPPPSAEKSGPSQPRRINHRPCSGTQATSTVKAGMKRKVDDEDGTMSETAHPSKRVKSSWHRLNCADPPTSSSSQDCCTCIQASTVVRTTLAQAHPSKMSQNQSYKPGVKRKADDEDVGHRHTDSDHNIRSDDGRKRFQRNPAAGLSTSSSSSRTHRLFSPRVERRTAYGERPDGRERSGHERQAVRKSLAVPSACGHDTDRTLHVQPDRRMDLSEHRRRRRHHNSAHASTSAQTESRVQSELKRRAAHNGEVLRGNRTSDLRANKERKRSVVCSEEDRRRRKCFISERRTSEHWQYSRAKDDHCYSSSARPG
ncbi:homeodomain-interacting protein kinase 1-like [Sebastes umbrosus]|uniref:homeodomain-interacting protein kinase 1-like n=1 Tax=Sebastes umbrosus TaxID=72105 RepID=UPI0018A0927E|nr:homeodomain-interacting protein kinase 1-like [Sebastes umbrosus]